MTPYKSPKETWWGRLQVALASTRFGAWLIKTFIRPFDPFILKLTGGRFTAAGPVAIPHLLLTTIGRKSGKEREVPLCYIEHDGAMYLIASNFGQKHHPGWSYNLESNPSASILIGTDTRDVRAVRLSAEEVDEVWPFLVDNIALYDAYRTRTERDIKVFRLD